MAHTTQLFSLISSLPALQIFEAPAIDRGDFLLAAQAFLAPDDLAELAELSIAPDTRKTFRSESFAAKYSTWETAFRHSILKLQLAKHKNAEAQNAPPFRRDTTFECDADAAAAHAFSAADPLEREKLLDRARWDKTEELTVNHFFDLDRIQAYFIRLQIAEKWGRRASGDAAANFDAAAEAVEIGADADTATDKNN